MGKILQLLQHPDELKAIVQYKCFRKSLHPLEPTEARSSLKRCDELLKLTSRSFAAVIKELHPKTKVAVMVFYLVLRALDTVEDDMTIQHDVKIPLLREFHTKLNTADYSFNGSGPNEKDRAVLVDFPAVLAEYHRLDPEYQDVIKDITDKMGNGMADYILDDDFNANGVATVKDYDLYCHYVAGLVGEGLTKIMAHANFINESLNQDNYQKSESMGLFLQKTNIIRDYQEDMQDGRSFWPKEIWLKYTDTLASFYKDQSEKSQEQALYCISELVLNAMNHINDALVYLANVNDPSCFSFCAIPQVMAVATLAAVYNNLDVTHKVVKIRKGTTVKLILESRTYPGVVRIFRHYIRIINHKSRVNDPNYLQIGLKCGELEQLCESLYPTPGAIPAGAKPHKLEVNETVANRRQIDEKIEAMIKEEDFKTKLLLVSLGLLLALLSYLAFTFLN